MNIGILIAVSVAILIVGVIAYRGRNRDNSEASKGSGGDINDASVGNARERRRAERRG